MSLVEKHIAKRIAAIQKRRNFNPDVGRGQIQGYPDLVEDFVRFRELLAVIRAGKLDVKIPYRSGGNLQSTREVAVEEPETFVYAFRKLHTSIFKIGWSKNPDLRIGDIQTGNETTLVVEDRVLGGRQLKRALKLYLREFKTRDRNKLYRSEWFEINPRLLAEVFTLARTGKDFSRLKPLDGKSNEAQVQ